ncbi:hypothetical protein HMPREF9404_3298 [Eggerthella sp. HGA1]|nr:hypothetical protein HMPREF9404_3298 [Eggerthella sp. HGA1]
MPGPLALLGAVGIEACRQKRGLTAKTKPGNFEGALLRANVVECKAGPLFPQVGKYRLIFYLCHRITKPPRFYRAEAFSASRIGGSSSRGCILVFVAPYECKA